MAELKKIYRAGVKLEKSVKFKEFVDWCLQNKDFKIKSLPEMHEIVHMRYSNIYNSDREEVGVTSLGFYFQYITFEYRDMYFYVQYEADYSDRLVVTPYAKTSVTKKVQSGYRTPFYSNDELIKLIDNLSSQRAYRKKLGGVNEHSALPHETHRMFSKMGIREKEIFDNLTDWYITRFDKDYHVMRFISNDKYFEYEINSGRITA